MDALQKKENGLATKRKKRWVDEDKYGKVPYDCAPDYVHFIGKKVHFIDLKGNKHLASIVEIVPYPKRHYTELPVVIVSYYSKQGKRSIKEYAIPGSNGYYKGPRTYELVEGEE